MKDSELENITSEKNKPSMLYVGLDALSLDNGDEPKVGHDEVSDAVTRARRKGGKAFTLYKPQTVKRLLKAVSEGLTLKQAAIASGISDSTLQSWRHKHPELVPMLEEAREQARQKALATIWEAREEDWRAAESFLKYSFWQDYRSGSQVNVNTATNVAVAVPKTLTEEERMKLIEQREKSQNKVNALQDKPEILEAQVVESEQPEPEQEQGTNQPPPGWVEQHEKVKQQAAINEKEQEEERLAEQRRRADAIRIRDLGF
jgi:hypothetical protein